MLRDEPWSPERELEARDAVQELYGINQKREAALLAYAIEEVARQRDLIRRFANFDYDMVGEYCIWCGLDWLDEHMPDCPMANRCDEESEEAR